ncbi:MAG: hypothetical protein M5U31_12305 [Acidimicrobiia bacterium]|nr:hypothetical protein [Acidimicrobiia bacterium]
MVGDVIPRTAFAALVVAAFVLLGFVGDAATASPTGPVERVLVISLPHLTWEDLRDAETPNLDEFITQSAIANLSTRVTGGIAKLGDGYATIGSGSRAVAPPEIAGQAFGPKEPFGDGTAGEAFLRRTGQPLDAAVGQLAIPAIVSANDATLFDAEPGLLGDELAANGIGRAVVANADRPFTSAGFWIAQREAALAAIDPDGLVPGGRVDRGLLEQDAEAPYGVQLDQEEVTNAFSDLWGEEPIVAFVEASDLARADGYREVVNDPQERAMTRRTLESTDQLLGDLLAEVDPASDAVLLVAPGVPARQPRLTVAALRAPHIEPGLLRSAVTRRDGFVTIPDVAPTILDLFGLEAPSAMEGRPFEVGSTGGTADERVDGLIDADADARFRDDILGSLSAVFIALQIALSIAAGVLVWHRPGHSRWSSLVCFGALALLGVIPATYLAAFFPFADWGTSAYVGFVVAVALAIAAVASSTRDRIVAPLLLTLGAILAVITISVAVLDSQLQLSTVFGDSPIVAGRFTGVNNVTAAALFSSAIIVAALLVHRVRAPRGAIVATVLLAAMLLVDVAPPWGSDVGGILTGVPAFAVTAALLWGIRVQLRTVLLAIVATGVAVVVIGGVDLLRPAADRTHLGRLFEDVSSNGWQGLELVVRRKLNQNLRTFIDSIWRLQVLAFLVFAGALAIRARDRLDRIVERIPEMRAAAWGLLVAAVLGFALNDSGLAVPGVMMAVANPVLVILLVRVGRDESGAGSTPRAPDQLAAESTPSSGSNDF